MDYPNKQLPPVNIREYFGGNDDYEREVQNLKQVVQKLSCDDGDLEEYERLEAESKNTFLGATSSSTVIKCFYDNQVSTLKTMPLIRYYNLKTLLNADSKYIQLFDRSDS